MGALLVSAAATVTSVFQTRVFANQLSAAVWPYLTFSTYESDTMFRYTLDNDGLGPAILRLAKVELDGKRYESFRDVGFVLLHGKPPRHSALHSSSLGDGEVIRPGVSLQIVEYDGPGARRVIDAARTRVRISVCYCSLLEQCWMITSSVKGHGPEQMARCTERAEVGA